MERLKPGGEAVTRPDVWLGGRGLLDTLSRGALLGLHHSVGDRDSPCPLRTFFTVEEAKQPQARKGAQGPSTLRSKAQCGPGTFILLLVLTGVPVISVPEPCKFLFTPVRVLLAVSLTCVFSLWIRRQKVGLYLWLNIILKHSWNAFPFPLTGPSWPTADTIDFLKF